MLFQISNSAPTRSGGAVRLTHCGVMEFSAQEGYCYLPYWMMQNLLLKEGDIVKIKNLSLKKATYVKFRPQTKDFLDISNPKAVLEKSLRTYSCMTQGDQFCIKYNEKKYFIDVLEVRPDGKASIIETDVSIDFAPPADYVEPSASKDDDGATAVSSNIAPPNPPDEEDERAKKKQGTRNIADLERGKKKSFDTDTEPQHVAFSGEGRRLDGKPLKERQRKEMKSSGNSNLAALAAERRKRMAAAAEARRKRNEMKTETIRKKLKGGKLKEKAFGGSGKSLSSS